MPKGMSPEHKALLRQFEQDAKKAQMEQLELKGQLQRLEASIPELVLAKTTELQQKLDEESEENIRLRDEVANLNGDVADRFEQIERLTNLNADLNGKLLQAQLEVSALKQDGREVLKKEVDSLQRRLAKKSDELRQAEQRFDEKMKLEREANKSYISALAKQLQETQAVLGMPR